VTVNVVPRPGRLCTSIVPPCASAIHLQMARPSPAPGRSPVRVRAESARRDADAGVGDRQRDPAIRLPQLHPHTAARRRVFDGVGDEVEDELTDATGVNWYHHWIGRGGDFHLDARLLGEQLAGLARFLENRPQVHRLAVQRRDALVRPREGEQRVH